MLWHGGKKESVMKNTIKRLPVNLTIPFLTEVCLLFNVHKFAEIFSFDVMASSVYNPQCCLFFVCSYSVPFKPKACK